MILNARRILASAVAVAAMGVGAAAYSEVDVETLARLEAQVASASRPDAHRARDKYRRPVETLSFCGIDLTSTVVEIWPGGQGGWYRRIIQPLVEQAGGTYIPVNADREFLGAEKAVPYGEVDMVLVFRAHGFMIYDKPAQNYVNSLYRMLRPGGAFCIVDHAGDENIPQDPDGENGYVNESHFLAMARTAGFELEATSDHNRNANDDKSHPRGVYSLPPSLRGTRKGSEERAVFLEIGESDRFSHRYRKPTESAAAVKSVWIDVRSASEHRADNIEGDPRISWDAITPEVLQRYPDKSTEIHLYCAAGGRAGRAAESLRAAGYTNVSNAGGIDDARSARELEP